LKIRFENIVATVRFLTGAIAFFIFVLVGALKGADLTMLLLGGLMVYLIFFVLGMVVAGIIGRINKENTIEPYTEEKKSHSSDLLSAIDMRQEAELPVSD